MSDAGDFVEIIPYNERWPQLFVEAERELRTALAPWLVDLEHIGSTAVPGLPAKPAIDIQIGVRTLADTPQIVVAMEAVGYEYVPEFEVQLPERRYFRRFSDGRRTHQIHLVERTNREWWDRHLAFRDWLRTHDADRDRYAELKQQLAGIHRDDRVGYTDAKTEFITDVVLRAFKQRGEVADTVRFDRIDPADPTARGALVSYLAEVRGRVPGAVVGPDEADDVSDYREPGGAFVLVNVDGHAIGCGAVRTIAAGVGEIKRMWISPSYRGVGLGARLLEALEHVSRALGHRSLRLDTNDVLVEASALYRSRGFGVITRYNDNPDATEFFEKRLS